MAEQPPPLTTSTPSRRNPRSSSSSSDLGVRVPSSREEKGVERGNWNCEAKSDAYWIDFDWFDLGIRMDGLDRCQIGAER